MQRQSANGGQRLLALYALAPPLVFQLSIVWLSLFTEWNLGDRLVDGAKHAVGCGDDL